MAASTGNQVPAYIATLFASYIEKAGGVEKFFGAPGAGGGGGGSAGIVYSIVYVYVLITLIHI